MQPISDEKVPLERPRRVAAFFDMDRTLLRCNTGTRWIQYQYRIGELSSWRALRGAVWMARYKLAMIDLEAVAAIAAADVRGSVEREVIEQTSRWLHEEILHEVAPNALAAIDRHRREGHLIAILSTGTPYVTEPVARYLGIEHVLCTRLHVEDGRLLGTHVRPACFGPGKVHWAERFATEHGVDLDASWFYTDSYSDLPMLQRVGVRRVVNPDPRLKRHARKAGWSIEEW
jgi:HAD superfamily hydrolase (TIGR01490 family)